MENSNSTVVIKKSYYYLAVILIAILVGVVFYLSRQNSNQMANAASHPKPALPLQVQERKALLGPGKVVVLTNISNTEIPVLVTFTSPKTHATASKQLVFEPRKGIEIGYAQGWAFSSGDILKISNSDYSDAQYIIR